MFNCNYITELQKVSYTLDIRSATSTKGVYMHNVQVHAYTNIHSFVVATKTNVKFTMYSAQWKVTYQNMLGSRGVLK